MGSRTPGAVPERLSAPWSIIDVTAAPALADADTSAVYAIGDIHGRLDLLLALEQRIAEDIAATAPVQPVIVYLGDYVDRGPASAQVIEHLASRPDDGLRRAFLKGNHEERMLEFLHHPEDCGPRWMEFGGREAFASYGLEVPQTLSAEDWPRLRDALASALPPAHLAFLEALQMTYRWGRYLFVHAGLNPDNSLVAQNEYDLLWIRAPFMESERDWGAVVVHGHVIVDEPQFRPNRIGIDTGAYKTGRLTCLVATHQAPRLLVADGPV